MSYKFLLFGLLSLLGRVNPAKYTVVSDDEEIVKPCKGEEHKSITKYFDLSNVTFEFVADDEVIGSGDVVSVAPLKKNDILYVSVEIHKEQRGEYVQPTIDIKRRDLCSAAFNPSEVWFIYSKNVPRENRVCPFVKGAVYHFQRFSSKNEGLVLPDNNLAGAYRATIRLGLDEQNSICTYYDFHLFRA